MRAGSVPRAACISSACKRRVTTSNGHKKSATSVPPTDADARRDHSDTLAGAGCGGADVAASSVTVVAAAFFVSFSILKAMLIILFYHSIQCIFKKGLKLRTFQHLSEVKTN